MRNGFIKRLLCLTVMSVSLLGFSSVGANAEWRQNSNGQLSYYNDGVQIKGAWFYEKSTGKWFYFDNNGIMVRNQVINGYAVGSDGTLITNKNNTDNETIKNIDDLKSYLNNNYSSLETPIGTLKFNLTVNENDNKMFPYDFEIKADWGDIENSKYDLYTFNPSDLNNSIKISDNDKEKTKELLKDYQKKIAEISMKYFPNKKIRGGFYSGFYKYQYLRTGYESVQFYSWRNYDLDLSDYKYYTKQYEHSTLSNFQWDDKDDNYNLD